MFELSYYGQNQIRTIFQMVDQGINIPVVVADIYECFILLLKPFTLVKADLFQPEYPKFAFPDRHKQKHIFKNTIIQ